MTSIENQVCVCKPSDTERKIGPSLKERDLTLIGSLPKQSNLEKYQQCCCINGKCKMSHLIRLCQEDPDIIINMYRVSKSEDKCLPEIDLDGGQTYDSAEKLDGTSGKRKYHYLMTDHSTSFNPTESRQEQKDIDAAELLRMSSHPSKEIAHAPKPILRKMNANLDLMSIKDSTKGSLGSGRDSNRTDISQKGDHISLSSTDDKTKSVNVIEPRISTALAEQRNLVHDSSHIQSLLNMVVKKQKQSVHTQLVLDEGDTENGRRCLNWLKCVPCVNIKKNRTRGTPSI